MRESLIPMRVETRQGWHAADDDASIRVPVEFRILLESEGDPIRIVGGLDSRGYPESARMEYREIGDEWFPVEGRDDECLAFARSLIRGDER